MSDIILNSTAVIPANSSELQQALVIKTRTSENAIETRKQVSVGLVKPEDEKHLTGESLDRERMVSRVTYPISGKYTVEARIDDRGNLFFNSENAALATKDAVIRIICLVCTPIECIKSVLSIHLHPAKGFIRARGEQRLDMQFGEEIEPIHVSNLYAMGESSTPTPPPHEETRNQEIEDKSKNDKKGKG